MKYLKYLLFLLLIAVIGGSIYIAVQPNSFLVIAKRSIKAPASVIYETILDTSSTDRSSFWKERALIKSTSTNAPNSIQQTYTSQDIGNSELTWKMTPNGDGSTEVSKSISAKKLSFFYKAKSIFSSGTNDDLITQITNDLEQLDNDILESMAKYEITNNGITEHGGGFYMYKTTSSTASNISNMMAQQFLEILNFMQDNSIRMVGMPFTIYNEMNADGNVIMSNAIPVANQITVAEESTILCGYMDRTRVLKTTLKGNYTYLDEAWKKAMQYLKDNNLEPSDLKPFEIYTNDPGDVPNPANWITELYIPLKPVESVENVPL